MTTQQAIQYALEQPSNDVISNTATGGTDPARPTKRSS